MTIIFFQRVLVVAMIQNVDHGPKRAPESANITCQLHPSLINRFVDFKLNQNHQKTSPASQEEIIFLIRGYNFPSLNYFVLLQ